MANIDPIRLLQPTPAQNVSAGNTPDQIESFLDQGLVSFPEELEAAKQNQQHDDPSFESAAQDQADLQANLQILPANPQSNSSQPANIADPAQLAQLEQGAELLKLAVTVPTLQQLEIAQEISQDGESAAALQLAEELAAVDAPALEANVAEAVAIAQAPINPVTMNLATAVAPEDIAPEAIAASTKLNPVDVAQLTTHNSSGNVLDGDAGTQFQAPLAQNMTNLSVEGLPVTPANLTLAQTMDAEMPDGQIEQLPQTLTASQINLSPGQELDGLDVTGLQKPSASDAQQILADESKAVADAVALLKQDQKTLASGAMSVAANDGVALNQIAEQAADDANSVAINQARTIAAEASAQQTTGQQVVSAQTNAAALELVATALPKAASTQDDGTILQQAAVNTESVLSVSDDAGEVIQGVRVENAKIDDVSLAKTNQAEDLLAKELALQLDTKENVKVATNTIAEPTGDPSNRTITSVFNQELRLSQSPFPLRMEPQQASLVAGPLHVEVMRVLREGGGRVIMELTPPDQGTIQLDLRLDGNGKAYLIVEGASDSTKARLEQGGSQLKEQMAQMGLSLSLDMRERSGQSDHVPFALNPAFSQGNSGAGSSDAINADVISIGRSGITPDGRISIYA